VAKAITTSNKITFFINFFGKGNSGDHTFMAYLFTEDSITSINVFKFDDAIGKIIAAPTALSDHLQTSR
jgi:hypothetical protein